MTTFPNHSEACAPPLDTKVFRSALAALSLTTYFLLGVARSLAMLRNA